MSTPSCLSLSPRLAAFCVCSSTETQSRLVSIRWPVDINAGREQKFIPLGHDRAWIDAQKLDRTLTSYPFDYFPRGRLEYFPPMRRWSFSVDPLLEASCFMIDLVETWKLPKGHVTVEREMPATGAACQFIVRTRPECADIRWSASDC